jgi:Mn-dependent DtxR family transcriptional regulator
MLTKRDQEYLKTIFKLQGSVHPVGPNKLAQIMGVSKVCAFQKMRRLEAIGFGTYIIRKGLILNQKAIKVIEQDIKKHHILEKFLKDTLKITFEEACDHSSHIAPFICDGLVDNIMENMDKKIQCNCGSCMDPTKNKTELENCHYLSKSV